MLCYLTSTNCLLLYLYYSNRIFHLCFIFLQVEQSFMTFEGEQLQGSLKIADKLGVSV